MLLSSLVFTPFSEEKCFSTALAFGCFNLNAAINTYTDDLPSPELFEMELKRWKSGYLSNVYKQVG